MPPTPGAMPKAEEGAVPKKQAGQGVVGFAPGVTIDFTNLFVEVDTRVVLRGGPLELLACSPQTREHESILAVMARPWHIYQAMGLIGLEPGAPARYDAENDRWVAAHGEPLQLDVRCRAGAGAPPHPGEGDPSFGAGEDHVDRVPVERWLVDLKTQQSVESVDWVFAASRTLPDGRFAADLEGTVVCVVDFSAALIAVGTSHSADNEMLWLAANEKAIPPIGTPCKLRISSARTLVVVVSPPPQDGAGHPGREERLEVSGDAMPAERIAEMLERSRVKDRELLLVVQGRDERREQITEAAIARLVKAGIDRRRIAVRTPTKVKDRSESDGDRRPDV